MDSAWSYKKLCEFKVFDWYICHFVYSSPSPLGFYFNILQRVTPWNVVKLRDAISNGPESHPGATHYADKVSTVRLPPKGKMLSMISRKLSSSRGVIVQHGKIHDHEFEGKVVYRHLKDGDIVLVNRQVLLYL